MQVNYTDENGTEKTLVATKNDEGKWSITEPTGTVATINETSGVISIPATEVKDGSEVIAKATDNSGNTTSDENAAKVIANENNSTGIKFSDDGASIIGKTEPEAVVVVKDENNIIISEGISDGEGRFTLPLNPALTNGENVKVIIDSGESGVKEIDLTAPDLTAPAAPNLVAEVDGSISVTPPTDNDVKSVQVNYTDENGTEKTLVASKNDEGKWSITEPTGTVATINETSGVISIPATEVKDGSEVIAKATDNSGNTTSDENAAKVIANENNSTGIKFSPDGASIIGKTEPEAVVVVKDTDGNVLSGDVADGSGNVILLLDPALTNGEKVIVTINEGEDNGKLINLVAPDLTAPEQPTFKDNNGAVEIIPPSDDDVKSVTVNYTDEKEQEKTVIATKEEGKWKITSPEDESTVSINTDTGVITIPATEVKDNSTVTATATDISGNPTQPATHTAGSNPVTAETSTPSTGGADDSTSEQSSEPSESGATGQVELAKPTLEAKDDGSVVINPPAEENVQSVVVSYTDEAGNSQTVTATKTGETWTITQPTDGSQVTIDENSGQITLSPGAVQDNSEVTAVAKYTDDKTSSDSVTSKADTDITAPNKPTANFVVGDDNTQSIEGVTEPNNKVTITLPNGETVTTTADTEGKYKVEIPTQLDGAKINVTATDLSGNVSDKTEVTVDLTAPDKPTFKDNNGAVEIIPPSDDDVKSVTVNYTDEKEQEKTVIATKEEGKWKITSPENESTVSIDPDTGVITIPATEVKDNSTVTATATDISGNPTQPASHTAGSNPVTAETSTPSTGADDSTSEQSSESSGSGATGQVELAKPTLEAKDDGSVVINPPVGENVQSVVVSYTDESDESQSVTATKTGETWTITQPTDGSTVTINTSSGTITLPAEAVKDNSTVTAEAKWTDEQTSSDKVEAKANLTNVATDEEDPQQGASEPTEDTSEKDQQTDSQESDKADGNGSEDSNTTTPVKEENGEQESENGQTSETDTSTAEQGNNTGSDETGTGTGTETEPTQESQVEGEQKEEEKGSETAEKESESDQSSQTSPAEDETKGEEEQETAQEEAEETPRPEAQTGEQAEEQKESSNPPISGATSEGGQEGSQSTVTTEFAKPTLDAKDDGSVVINPPAEENVQSVVVSYTDESDKSQSVTATKTGETWTITQPTDGSKVTIDENSGQITLSPGAVKDNSEVTAVAKGEGDKTSTNNVTSKADTDTTPPDAPTAEVVIGDDDKQSVEGTAEPNSKITITLPKDGQTVTTTTNSEGKYKVEIPTQENGAVLKVTATDEAGNKSDETDAIVKTEFTATITLSGLEDTGYDSSTEAGKAYLAAKGHSANTLTDMVTKDNTFDLSGGSNKSGAEISYQVSSDKNSWTDTTAQQANLADGTYYYRTVAKKGADTVYSEVISVTVDNTPPDIIMSAESDGALFIGAKNPAAFEPGSLLVAEYKMSDGTAKTSIIVRGPDVENKPDWYFVEGSDKFPGVVQKETGGFRFPAGSLRADSKVEVTLYNVNGDSSSSKVFTPPQIIKGNVNQAITETQAPAKSTGIMQTNEAAVQKMTSDGDTVIFLNNITSTNGRLETGAGDDMVIIKDRLNSGATVDMGEGNNTLFVGSIHNNSNVYFGSGDDVLSFNASEHWNDKKVFGYINTSAAQRQVKVNQDNGDHDNLKTISTDAPFIDLGDGNNVFTTTEGMGLRFEIGYIISGKGDDLFDLSNSAIYHTQWADKVIFNTGFGNDTFKLGGMRGKARIYLGDGDDTYVMVGTKNSEIDETGIFDRGTVYLGSGNDIVIVESGARWLGQLNGTYYKIEGGSGIDTINLPNSNFNLQYVSEIEVVNRSGGTLTLTDTAIVNNAAKEEIQFGNIDFKPNMLMIKGTGTVDFSNNAILNTKSSDTVTYDGEQYYTYSPTINGQTYSILIDTDINVI
ncbi:Ig-like domain-containing protein [Volucribacter amazonae]|uniref:Bacterial Ig domain-containing protein n=1 Tax=Volucribacter amazonae TaxID=256731 RepID=A0A9X4PD06_9PAST|nr:Ig-like domain-containing protein [Volucribacter amazonae]MDG6896032.1 hypothetical protein [Volucribacter amazonae]